MRDVIGPPLSSPGSVPLPDVLAKPRVSSEGVGGTSDEVLFRRAREDRASVLRDTHADENELVEAHRGLADRLAHQFANRGQPLEDLRQVAYLGLVQAARRFDASRGFAFATFARMTVAGELKKHFRDHAWTVRVTRPVQELYLAVRSAVDELSQTLGRAPTTAEIAQRVDADEDDVLEAIEAASAMHVDSLDRPRNDEDDSGFDPAEIDAGFGRVDDRSWLVPALAALSAREQRILRLRFVDGLPQSAIAALVGISQMHVSRLIAKALATLRSSAPGA